MGIGKQRQAIRFDPDVGAYAEIGYTDQNSQWVVEKVALILNESYTGCGLILVDEGKFQIGTRLLVKVHPLEPLFAEVVWRKPLEEKVVRIGLKYLE